MWKNDQWPFWVYKTACFVKSAKIGIKSITKTFTYNCNLLRFEQSNLLQSHASSHTFANENENSPFVISWSDCIHVFHCENVLSIMLCAISCVVYTLCITRLRWFGHVCRMKGKWLNAKRQLILLTCRS